MMKNFFKIFGPGLLYAGAAIGVSHLVQSTRAGAQFNFDLVWVLLLANFLKYPFFEYGPRYAIATGETLFQGYEKVGKWAVFLFIILTVGSIFIITAAVTVVTVGLLSFILKINFSVAWLSVIVLLISTGILIVGKFRALDTLMKIIIILLTVSTIAAVFSAIGIDKRISPDFITSFEWDSPENIFFLIAFVGWMPAPIDISVWSSIWNLEKNKQLGFVPKMRDVLIEFRVGFIATAVLGVGFLALGALVMYATGEQFSENGTIFSEQLINMYTTSLGSWAYWIISIAAFTTMFSTLITVLDAYSRVMNPIYKFLFPGQSTLKKMGDSGLLILWLLLTVLGTSVIIFFAGKSMLFMVTVATTLSFLTAPVLAWLNFKVVTGNHMPAEYRPGAFLKALSWIGLAFLILFSFIYLYWQYIVY